MDLFLTRAVGPDKNTGIFKVFGDENQPYDYTSTDDLAKYIAAVALDAEAGRVVRVAGDTLSPRELGAVFAELFGVPVKLESAGSLEDLDRIIAKLRSADEALANLVPAWQQLQYLRDMASGRGKLSPLDNARYPAIRPQTVREYLRSHAT
jgi:nucleoside-diphosphate-sugar epimerase